MTEEDLLTVDEIAADLRVSRMTIYRLVHAGALPSLRIGRTIRIRRSAYATYLRQEASL